MEPESFLNINKQKFDFFFFFQLKTIDNGNLQHFIGISLSASDVCEFIVAELCTKGTLTDVLENEMIKLDWFFKNSMIRDIVLVID